MTSDDRTRADRTTAGRWDEEQMRIDDGAGDPLPPRSGGEVDRDAADETDVLRAADVVVVDPEAGVITEAVVVETDAAAGDADEGRSEPGWNKGQMAIDDAGEPQPRYDPDAMPESQEGPTGGRANPGGGERFGEIDDTGPKDRKPTP